MNYNEIATNMTDAGRTFLIDLCRVAGNGNCTSEELAKYRNDMYTWFNASDLLGQYSKEQIGGFLSNLYELQLVDGKGREAGLTEDGVEVAIEVCKLAGL